MANNKLVFEGLAELKEALRNLPQELKREASNHALAAANGAAVDIRRGYPSTAEGLAQAVEVLRDDPGPVAAGATVRTKHKLAWIFENGTQIRSYITAGGKRHVTGKYPAASGRPLHVFVPPIMRARIRFYNQLREMLRRHGLTVSG